MQLAAVRRAKDMGLQVVAIDPSPGSVGFRCCDAFCVADLADVVTCLDFARRHAVDGVMTIAADYPVPTVAHICSAMGLPGLTNGSAKRSTNKRHMRHALAASGALCPTSISAETLPQAIKAVRSIDGAAILKPAVSNGGRGVTRLERGASCERIATAFARAMHFTRADGIVVEEFLDGPEFSVEALTYGGRTHVVAVTDKLTAGDPYCVEVGHSQPSRLGTGQINALKAAANAGIAALGIDWSASHAEIRLTSRGPHIMEIGARLGGGYITSHLVPLSTGIDMIGAAISVALGREPALQSTHTRGAAIRFFTPAPGVVERISGLDIASQVPGVRVLDLPLEPGDTVRPLRDSTGRVGHVICEAGDAAGAIRSAEQAKHLVRIETRAPDLLLEHIA